MLCPRCMSEMFEEEGYSTVFRCYACGFMMGVDL